MKKTLSILGMLILISSVVLAGGTPNPSTSSTSSKMAIVKCGDVVKVFYKNDESTKVKVTIYNQENKAVFSEEVKSHAGFVRPYNIGSMPEGDYRVVMQDENEKREENVSTLKEHVKSLVGIIKASEDQFAVTFFTKEERDLRVRLLDSNKNVLFSDEYSVNGRASKLFNLKSVKGAVVVEVADEDGVIKSTTL